MDLMKMLGLTRPEQVEVKPGTNVLFGKKVLLRMRVWREKEQRWHEVPDEK